MIRQQSTLPTARDLMSRRLHSVIPDTPLLDVLRIMTTYQVSHIPVLEIQEEGKTGLVGFLSEGDCLERLTSEMRSGSPNPGCTARLIMKRHPVCVSPETDIETLASILASHHYNCLPVVEGRSLVGMVNRRDVLRSVLHLKSLEQFQRERIRNHNTDSLSTNVFAIVRQHFQLPSC